MKRKSEISNPTEPKIASLSPFLKEETLDIHEIHKDVDDFLGWYNKFVKYVTEIYDKKEKTNAAQAAYYILKFKELNRKAQFRLNISREKTKETKDSINKNHLMMQNLLYEALHLEKETNSCLEYKSLHEDIDLVSLEQFIANAPTDLRNSETEHESTLNRLHWELCERKSLSSQIDEAERAEQTLMEEINKKKQAYADISTHLQAVFDSTQSLEDIFDMPMHRQESQNEIAESLPEPLYVLYSHMRVHADLEEQRMKVSLVEENGNVCVLVDLTEGLMQLALLFQFDSGLSLITVLPRLDPVVTRDLCPLTKCLLDPVALLSELPGDHGCPLDSPWIRARTSEPLNTTSRGLPYLWCQRLCGTFHDVSAPDLKSRQSSPPPEYLPASSAPRVPPARPLSRLCEDIRHRLRSRVHLATELSAIATGKLPPSFCSTSDWTLSSKAAFAAQCDSSSAFLGCGLATEQCFFFTAVARSSRHAGVAVPLWLVVPHSYPDNHPIVVLNKNDGGVLGSPDITTTTFPSAATVKYALHMVEVEVNCFCEEFPDNVLSNQVSRLHSAMELLLMHLLAAEGTQAGPLFLGGKFPATKRPFKSLQ